MVKTTLRSDGALEVLLTGADSAIITSVAYERRVTPEDLLRGLIEQAALSGNAGKLGLPVLVR